MYKVIFDSKIKIRLMTLSLITVSLVGCGKKSEKIDPIIRPVKTVKIENGVKYSNRQYPAQVDASQKVNLSFQVAGKITSFPVKQGQQVKKGEILAKLDDADYESEYKRALAVSTEAKSDFERIKKLYDKGVSSKADLDVKQKEYDVAVAETKIKKKALNDTVLRAPFDGIVGKTFAENYEDVKAKHAIISLNDISSLEISVDVPEEVMSNIEKYQNGKSKAEVEFATLPGKRFKLTSKEFATEADTETLTYKVVFSLDAPTEITVLPGMTATAHHTVKLDSTTTYLLPTTSLISSNSGELSFVWIYDQSSSTVKKRAVQVENIKNGGVVISSGLHVGDHVVTAGVNSLVENQKVTLLSK